MSFRASDADSACCIYTASLRTFVGAQVPDMAYLDQQQVVLLLHLRYIFVSTLIIYS